MNRDTFIGQVRARPGLGSRGAAEAATRAPGNPRRAHPRRDGEQTGGPAAREVGEHLRRVATASVVEAVGEATEGGVLDRVRQALDDELAQLLSAGSTGGVT